MPKGDGTGPQGQGPGSGRGLGRWGSKGGQNSSGKGGQGKGLGRGWRHMYYATGTPGRLRSGSDNMGPAAGPDPELEKQELEVHAETLQRQLDDVKKRLDELANQ